MSNMYGEYTAHPAADAYPLITGGRFDSLVQSIKDHGLKDPVEILVGTKIIIDGRNRYRACVVADVTPRIKEIDLDELGLTPMEYTAIDNLHRHHLTEREWLIIAAKLMPVAEEEAKERKAEAGKAAAKAGGQASGRARSKTEPSAESPAQGSDGGSTPAETPKEDRPKPRRAENDVSEALGAVGPDGKSLSPAAIREVSLLEREAPDIYQDYMNGKISRSAATKARKALKNPASTPTKKTARKAPVEIVKVSLPVIDPDVIRRAKADAEKIVADDLVYASELHKALATELWNVKNRNEEN